jgi:N-acetylmuramoyl-L-alanine amidase
MATYNVHGGHSLKCRGVSDLLDEVTEDRAVKNKLIELLRANGDTVYDCTDDYSTTQSANLSSIVSKCNAHNVDLDISIHLNSARNDRVGDGKCGGVEVYGYDDRIYGTAYRIAESIANTLGIGFHGAPVKYNKELYVLRKTRAKAILIECCFVDDRDDVTRWDSTKCAMAIASALGCKTNASTVKPTHNVSRETYFTPFKSSSCSIVDCLKSIGVDSSYAYRQRIASKNGIANYKGSAPQNDKLVSLGKKGKLMKP